MANWEAMTVADALSKISDNIFVLPVIQRRLVWKEDKMEMLFDTLLKGDSFGSVICIEEERGQKPLFSYRSFTKNGEDVDSIQKNILEQSQFFIIDGQQRLQSFYIGFQGTINRKMLYFDLFSDYKNLDYTFKFENDELKLPKQDLERDDNIIKEHKWYSVYSLFNQLKKTHDEDQVADEIIKLLNITDPQEINYIMRNVKAFFRNVFISKNIGISKININKTFDENSNKQRIVELFRRLNDGGTVLSSYDLVASKLKGYEWKMEKFLSDVIVENADIGLTQDSLISLLFILRDAPLKNMIEIDHADAEFATKYSDRIQITLKLLKKFLIASGLYNYYTKEKNRSFIPLYFIAYNIFYRTPLDNELPEDLFNRFDTSDSNFKQMYIWIYKSLLNGVFSRGSGWIPYKTGIKKLSNCIKEHKGKDFPTNEIFNVYYSHPLNFTYKINESMLRNLDRDIVFYIIYNNQTSIREQDVDHIHPVNILQRKNVFNYDMNTIANYQLLDSSTNRGEKNGKSLADWINNYVKNKELYLKRHLIPNDPELWNEDNFKAFIDKRSELIVAKINSFLTL